MSGGNIDTFRANTDIWHPIPQLKLASSIILAFN
jgi:hypothetical protein